MMEMDIEGHHHETLEPIHALSAVADALPGLGIVAAVLGIVITMGALGGPPEEIGHKVAAALVGTFLGILMCYGFLGPISSAMTKTSGAETDYYKVLRMALISFVKGSAPILAVEFARRMVPAHIRPSFKEMEKTCKGGPAGA
jgi:chemotaxis protein MotA